jgi:uncharacterized protein DUF6627
MTQLLRDIGTALLLGLVLALAVPNVYAGMIGTDEAAPDAERDRVKTMLERPELAAEMQKMGVAPEQARARVDAMTPAEVAQLAGRLDAVQAGGALSNQDLLLIILLIVLIAILI